MHPSLVTELLQSYHREHVERHQKLVRMRIFEITDRAWTDADGTRHVAAGPPRALIGKIAGWLGRMRPARAG